MYSMLFFYSNETIIHCGSACGIHPATPFVLRYNICVLIQITFFFKVHHLILVLPLGRDSRRNFCGLSWHPSKQCTYTTNEQLWWRSCPLHKSFHCQRDHRQTTGGLVGGEWGGTFRFLKEAGSRDSRRPGGGPCRRVFSTLHISCAAGKLQHPWASWKWLQTLFAKALYVMAICLFGVWALSHAVLRCAAGGERWEQLFNLHSREATIDWKVPFPTWAIHPWLQTQKCQSRTGCPVPHVSGRLL